MAREVGDDARRAGRYLLNAARNYPSLPVRRAISRGAAPWVDRLPESLRRRLELDGSAIEPLRVEIGGGPYPSPGYVHVDADRRSRHLEYVAPAWELPFDDGTVAEILAIHVLEHVHASAVDRTLREWRRVLRPGGFAEIHVPNAATVFPAFLEAPVDKKWSLMVAIFGMPSHASSPEVADELDRHQVIYDFALLQHVVLAAGFDHIDDVSADVTDRHTEGWRDNDLVSRLSLVARAVAGPAADKVAADLVETGPGSPMAPDPADPLAPGRSGPEAVGPGSPEDADLGGPAVPGPAE